MKASQQAASDKKQELAKAALKAAKDKKDELEQAFTAAASQDEVGRSHFSLRRLRLIQDLFYSSPTTSRPVSSSVRRHCFQAALRQPMTLCVCARPLVLLRMDARGLSSPGPSPSGEGLRQEDTAQSARRC